MLSGFEVFLNVFYFEYGLEPKCETLDMKMIMCACYDSSILYINIWTICEWFHVILMVKRIGWPALITHNRRCVKSLNGTNPNWDPQRHYMSYCEANTKEGN